MADECTVSTNGSFARRTCVMVGISSNEYYQLVRGAARTNGEPLSVYASTGSYQSVAAGRVAYTYGLQGPALS
eukprot:2496840-Pyramimonas_sp.AAC.1